MTTADFLRKHHYCRKCAEWALSISDDMADVWDAMIKQNRHDWLLWVAIQPGVFSDTVVRKLACRFVRETPLSDGRKVWDLLADERSRKAVEVAEAYAEGGATDAELSAAYAAARGASDASYAAYSSAYAAAADAAARAACAIYSAARDAARAAGAAYCAAAAAARDAADAARSAYYAAAKSAQVQMIAELGNPFKEELVNQ